MSVYGLTHGWFGSDDGPLRPSSSFWDQVNAMHRVDADAERSIFDAAWDDQRQPGMRELTAKGPGVRGHTDNGSGSNAHRSDEEIIFVSAWE